MGRIQGEDIWSPSSAQVRMTHLQTWSNSDTSNVEFQTYLSSFQTVVTPWTFTKILPWLKWLSGDVISFFFCIMTKKVFSLKNLKLDLSDWELLVAWGVAACSYCLKKKMKGKVEQEVNSIRSFANFLHLYIS